MPKLTDVDCRNASCPPEKKHRRLNDGGGLYLEVSPKGSKRWFWKYTLAGVEKRLALGSYSDVSLSAARRERNSAKEGKSLGTDPVQAKKVAKLKALIPADETFKAVALEWHALKKESWGQAHTVREERNLIKDLIPYLGQRRIGDIEPVELLTVIRKVEERGSISVAHRVLSTAGALWDHAVSTGRASRDISSSLRGALKTHHPQHFAAIIEPIKFGELLRAIEGYQGSAVVRAALKLSPILFQRPGELRCATWSEFDLDNSTWTIPAKRMKRDKKGKLIGHAHMVPLPTQAVEILRDLQILTGHGRLLFPGERSHDRPISDNTLNAALRTLGYGRDVQVVHGFRASARTMLEEILDIKEKLIEAQLAHAVKDANGTAYNRTKFFKQRAEMIQTWADFLDKLRRGGDVIALPVKAAAN